MSIFVMSAVWKHGPEDRSDLLVLLAIADFADDDGYCWPSMQTIADKARMTERGAQKIVRRLEEAGLISVQIGSGRRNCNQYRVNLAALQKGEQETPNPVHPEPCSPRTAEHKPRTAEQKTPNGGSPEPSRTIIEPPEEQKRPSKRAVSLPEGWIPSEQNTADAKARNFTDEEIDEQAAAFRDYHLARGTTFKDWNAGWRTWLGNARRFARPATPRNARPRSAHDVMFAGFQSAAMRDDGRG